MFRSIIMRVCVHNHQEALHTCTLVAAYLGHNVEDRLVFSTYFCTHVPYRSLFFYLDISEDATIELALSWFRLMTKKGWTFEDGDESCFWGIERVKEALADILRDYLRSKTPSLEMMERIVRDTPGDIVARYFRHSVHEARTLREREDDGSEDD